MNVRFSQKQNALSETVYIDSDCTMSLIDQQFFHSLILDKNHKIE